MRDMEQPVTAAVVADYLGKSVFTVREYAKAGTIPAHKPFGTNQWHFFMSEVREAIGGKPSVFNQSPRAKQRRTATRAA
jgi:hypothetical protein